MSNEESLLLLLAVLYLFECLLFPRAGSTLFFSRFRRQWQSDQPEAILHALHRGVFLSMPLPPLGRAIVVPGLPCAVSEHGIGISEWERAAAGQRPNYRNSALFAWHEISSITADGANLRVNNTLLANCDSAGHASWLAGALNRIRQAPPAERGAAIDLFLRERCDASAILHRVLQAESVERPLRLLTNTFFVAVFTACPLIVWRFGFEMTWIYVIGGVLALWLSTLIAFYAANRTLFARSSGGRLARLANMVLLPPAAIRACDALWRDLLTAFDPLAVAFVLSGQDAFPELARKSLIDSQPAPVGSDETHDPQRACRDEFQQRQRRCVDAFMIEHRIDRSALLAAPLPDGPASRSYCPRCHGQFVFDAGTCPRCAGTSVVAFPHSRGAS